ncbi:hypothetical protein [Nostoc sp.]|uniref:hypothetical protein n=1 Tax=Nostoc sp. TaxID=1180 RepID=UPI002FFB4BDB
MLERIIKKYGVAELKDENYVFKLKIPYLLCVSAALRQTNHPANMQRQKYIFFFLIAAIA